MPQIRLQLNPSGPGCNHIIIRDESNRVLRTVVAAQLRAPVGNGDDLLMAQIKRVVRDSGLVDPALIKTALEVRDFDF